MKHTRGFSTPLIVLAVAVMLVIGFIVANAGGDEVEDTPTATSTVAVTKSAQFLISAMIPPPKGFDMFMTQDLLTQNGANVFIFSVNWDTLEPAPGTLALGEHIGAAYQAVVPKYPFKDTALIIKMIDTGNRTMPADLKNKPFDDPKVVERFLAMLHEVATTPGVKGHIGYVLLGNEVDSYFKAHPKELDGFMSLLQKSINQLHEELPGVQVGTITTFDSLKDKELFTTLTKYSDYINYTYYPLGDKWTMRPVADAPADIAKMAQAAGAKPFGFTELGYSSSVGAKSSEAQQAEFLTTVFAELDKYRSQVAYVQWAGLSDTPLDVCQTYARSQRVPSFDTFCDYGSFTGLRTYENQPKPSWDAWVKVVKEHR